MAINLNTPSMYVKGTADIWVFDIQTGDVVGYSNKLDTSSLSSSVNTGEIRAGLGAPVVMTIPDSATFTGEVTAQDFSLEARQLQTGGTLKYNGTGVYRENITATGATLTVSKQPVAAYGESSTSEKYSCFVGTDGVNYGVDPETKQVQGFAAETGKTYCVMYFAEMASAKELAIPTAFAPSVNRIMIRMACYSENGSNASNSSFAGYLYIHLPRAKFNGDVATDGSQTSNATTAWTFTTLAYNEADVSCAECAMDNSVLGYMVFVPCGDVAQAVKALVVVGGGVSVPIGKTAQIPVYYVMDDNTLVTPQYSDLTYVSGTPGKATVSDKGVVSGVAVGDTNVTITVTSKPTISAIASVTVTA